MITATDPDIFVVHITRIISWNWSNLQINCWITKRITLTSLPLIDNESSAVRDDRLLVSFRNAAAISAHNGDSDKYEFIVYFVEIDSFTCWWWLLLLYRIERRMSIAHRFSVDCNSSSITPYSVQIIQIVHIFDWIWWPMMRMMYGTYCQFNCFLYQCLRSNMTTYMGWWLIEMNYLSKSVICTLRQVFRGFWTRFV